MGDIFDAFGDEQETQPRAQHKAKKRRRSSSLRASAVVAILLAIIAGVSVFAVPKIMDAISGDNPLSSIFGGEEAADYPAGQAGETVQVTIPAGSNGTDMARILFDADVVASAQAFIDAFNADSGAGSIQPGTYELTTKLPASQAIELLKDHKNQRIDLSITIPEGFTKNQVHERVANVMGVSVDEVDAAAADLEAIGLPAEAGGNVEGWYHPGTERFGPTTPITEILRTFIANRVAELDELGVPADQREAVLTKASILEREVNIPEYYPQVARVIENRLTDTATVVGRLQMDSTVLYGVGKTGGIPTREDLDNDNPYNTYIHQGLPPSPIGQPGIEAIRAVLNPADGDWLFFATVNLQTGETLFAATLEEHNANVAKLRQWIQENPNYGSQEGATEGEGGE